jgi:hypothetical protein
MSENMKDFREWLVFSINSARFVPDAIDPKAADILENVLERFDEYAKSTNIKLTLPNPPNPNPHVGYTFTGELCQCIYHRQAGVQHFMACCHPKPSNVEPTVYIA